jgi:microcystin-dependent protein
MPHEFLIKVIMPTPVLAEIRIISFPFAPQGWALCEGQLLPISQNQALYSILGTMYGGDGQTTFALPDVRPLPEIRKVEFSAISHRKRFTGNGRARNQRPSCCFPCRPAETPTLHTRT